MRRLIAAFILLMMITEPASAWWEVKYDTTRTFWPNGNLKEQWTSSWFTANEKGFIKNGQYTAWYKSSHKQEEGEYLDGEKEYTWIRWYEDGQRSEETSYHKGKKNGRNVAWHPNHDMEYIAYYRNGTLHGLYTSGKPTFDVNNPDLSLIDVKFYFYGHPLVTFYQESEFVNSMQRAGSYHDPVTGFWVIWDKNVTEFYVGEKVEDKKHGKWTLWAANGQIIREDIYKNGELISME